MGPYFLVTMTLSQRPSGKPSLLLVDDDPTFCGVLKQALQKRGFEVYVANDLTSSIHLTEQVDFEYAVIDLSIGRDSGLILVKRLHESDANTRIVVSTGFVTMATAAEVIKIGAVNYLSKPADADEIVAALHGDNEDPSQPS